MDASPSSSSYYCSCVHTCTCTYMYVRSLFCVTALFIYCNFSYVHVTTTTYVRTYIYCMCCVILRTCMYVSCVRTYYVVASLSLIVFMITRAPHNWFTRTYLPNEYKNVHKLYTSHVLCVYTHHPILRMHVCTCTAVQTC